MSRTPTIIAVIFAGVVAAWGCSQSPTGAGNPGRDARVAKLEQDLRAIEKERDAVKVRVAAVEEKLKTELARVQGVEQERDTLRAELAARNTEREALQVGLRTKAAERDAVQAQFDGFKKNLKDLLGQMEPTVAPPSNPGATSALSTPRHGL